MSLDRFLENFRKVPVMWRFADWMLERRRPRYERAFRREQCEIDCTLIAVKRMVRIPGRLLDISAGGALFRPRLRYLMDRRGEPVSLTINGVELVGYIAHTMPKGYGLRFDAPLVDHDLDCVLSAGDAAQIA
jgi:hypothetical protein